MVVVLVVVAVVEDVAHEGVPTGTEEVFADP